MVLISDRLYFKSYLPFVGTLVDYLAYLSLSVLSYIQKENDDDTFLGGSCEDQIH